MAANERERDELFRRLAELIGEEHAGTLMRHLPPEEWPELATKDDLERAFGELRAEIGELRGELRGEIGELRAEIGDLRGEMRGEIGGVRGEIGDLRAEVHEVESRLLTQITKQSRTFILTTVTAVVGSVGTTAAIAFAAAGLV